MSANEALAVQAAGLGRSFGQNRAIDGVDLTIPIGMIFGLLGPDGAGKSTLIRMLATVLAPDTGDATIFGNSVRRSRGRGSHGSATCRRTSQCIRSQRLGEPQFLRHLARNQPGRARAAGGRADVGDGLVEFADMRARNLSGGMKQKLMLAATLIHQPDLLLLDEPTTGVDPVSRREFWRILARLHREGKTVLVSTPYMDEAERCSYLAFLSDGRISHEGSPANIKAVVPGTLFELATPQPGGTVRGNPEPESVRRICTRRCGPSAVDGWQRSTKELTSRLVSVGLSVTAVRPARVDMEAAFAFLTESERLNEVPQP